MDHETYLETKITPILQELTEAILVNKPISVSQFMLDWLKERSGESISQSERAEMFALRSNMNRMAQGQHSDSEETEDESEDEVDEEQFRRYSTVRSTKQRFSVSAEVFGAWNPKGNFKPRVIPKSPEIKENLTKRLSKGFMFAALDESDRNIVIDAMEERKIPAGEIVIRQGDDGNELFVVGSGNLVCTKIFDGEERVLKTYKSGEVFGELALLYNAPRAASIRTESDCTLWVLDRECFNHIVKEAAVKKREKYEQFLGRVNLLESMDPYEKSQLADVLRAVHFNEGEYVITEGEWGELFYIIEEGTAEATKTISPGCPPRQVKEYSAGDYFGELALLRGEPRAANIIATSPLKCVTLDRHSFRRLLGPLQEILRRNAEIYSNYINS